MDFKHYRTSVSVSPGNALIIRAVRILYFHAPEDVIHKRIIERGKVRDSDKLKDWKSFLLREPILISQIEKYEHLLVDSSKPVENNLMEIITFLKGENPNQ